MSRGRSGHGGSSITAVQLATRLIAEVNAAAETFLATHTGGEHTREQDAPFVQVRTSLQQLESLNLPETIAALEQEIADAQVAVTAQVESNKAALHEQYMESVRIGNSIKQAHIYSNLPDLEERQRVATEAWEEKVKALAGLEEREERLAAVTAEVETKQNELAAVEGRLAEVRSAIAKLQA